MSDRGNLEGHNRNINEDQAKARFFLIAGVRLAGALMVMIGLLGINGALPLPDIASYALVGIGLLDVFVMPIFLSKRWSSRNQ